MGSEKIILPAVPCFRCGGRRFWYRAEDSGQGDWLCSWCHHPPDDAVVPVITFSDNFQDREIVRQMVEIMTREDEKK